MNSLDRLRMEKQNKETSASVSLELVSPKLKHNLDLETSTVQAEQP